MRVPRVHAKERPPRLKAPETAELGSTELYNPWSSFALACLQHNFTFSPRQARAKFFDTNFEKKF